MNPRYRVLVADDERAVAAGLQAQLESIGHDVIAVVGDGQHAVDFCRRALPDVAVLDIEMPGLDGISAARQIAADPATPVVILSAHGSSHLIDQAAEEGVVSYLLKPVTTTSLDAALRIAVARAKDIQSLRDEVEELHTSLRDRKLIERAKGILMARRKMTEFEAFRLLQKQSQDRRLPMAKLAESIVEAEGLLDPDASESDTK